MRVLTFVVSLLLAAAVFAQEPEPEQEPYSEIIDVVRYGLDVRVTDYWGHAIEDLTAADFTVTIGGKPAHVESASWIAEGRQVKVPDVSAAEDEDADEEAEAIAEQQERRSIVLFIQTDFARNSIRVLGQMKFNYVADKIIALLGPYDRVAVLSHDSHLKFRRDFTMDRESIRKAVRESLFIDEPPPPAPATDGPSLIPLLDRKEMKRAAHAEAALLVIAKAIHRIEGPKMIILAGWGVGELQGRAGVQLKAEWSDAVRVLHRDHVPVITLGTGLGGELTSGLMATAQATGGFYSGTQSFESQSIVRVAGALAGHYALSLRLDDLLKPGDYALDVRVNRKGVEVQAPSTVSHGR